MMMEGRLHRDVSRVWSYWLTFKSKDVEDEYRVHQKMVISQTAPFLHRSGFILGFVSFAAASVFQATSWGELIVSLVTEVLGPGLMNYVAYYHKGFFVERYDLISISVQVVIACVMAVRPAVMEKNVYYRPVFVILRYTPVIPMIMMSIFYPTTFWAQFLGQALGSVVSYPWIHNVCVNTLISSKLSKGANTVLWNLQTWLSTIFVISPTRSHGVHSCFVSLGFVHYVLSFVIPCAAKYILESQARATYLASRLPFSAIRSINYVLWENIRWCGYVCVLSLVSILLVIPTFPT